MRGWVVYDDEGAARNAWFAGHLQKTASDLRVELELVPDSEVVEKFSEGSPPDFVLVRTINPCLSRWLEDHGALVINNAATSMVANDKWKTYCFCMENGIPVMPTTVADRSCDFHGERVMKSVDGHGGSEVFLVKDRHGAREVQERFPGKTFILQELCTDAGCDMRAYVIGGEVVAAVLRTSKGGFRSNYSLGGDARCTSIEAAEKGVIARLNALLSFGFVGVDFIRHQGKWVLNEIEDVVGSRMLYSCSDIDIALPYMKYAMNCARRRRRRVAATRRRSCDFHVNDTSNNKKKGLRNV